VPISRTGASLRLPPAMAASATVLESGRGVVYRDQNAALLAIGFGDRAPVLRSTLFQTLEGVVYYRPPVSMDVFNTVCRYRGETGDIVVRYYSERFRPNPTVPDSARYFQPEFRSLIALPSGAVLNVLGSAPGAGARADSLFATRILLGQLLTLR
jgi:hypothetical protein